MSNSNQPDDPRIHPDGVYSDGDLRVLLGVTDAALSRARREGRLRHSRQGKRVIYRGVWVISWLEADADQRARAELAYGKAGTPEAKP